jgi:sugar transferase (PEP-CTERM/EpsH1 system associated)
MADLLFLAHRIPFPPDRGDKIRSFHELRHLARLGRVHLACFADDESDAANLAGLREAIGPALGEAHVEIRRTSRIAAGARALLSGRPVSLAAFDSPSLRGFVERMLGRGGIATIFVFSGQMAQFVPNGTPAHFVMDFGDVDSAKFESYAADGGPLAWIHRREGRELAAFERETAERADVSLFVSEAEAVLFRSRSGLHGADIRALQNGVDLDYFSPGRRPSRVGAPLIAFTGQMDYAPNIDAVRWFSAEVMPFLPDARFAIVGRNPPPAVQRLAGERVTVTGAVADVRDWLAAADVVAAPLRIARGIQNKVLEAMAMARPVVASPAAFEGIEAEPGRDLLVAESASAQAEAIAGLFADSGRARTIGLAARRRMEEAYRWDARLKPLAQIAGLPARRAAA